MTLEGARSLWDRPACRGKCRLRTAVVCDGPGLIVSSAHRKARARLSIARFQTIQEGLVQAK